MQITPVTAFRHLNVAPVAAFHTTATLYWFASEPLNVENTLQLKLGGIKDLRIHMAPVASFHRANSGLRATAPVARIPMAPVVVLHRAISGSRSTAQ